MNETSQTLRENIITIDDARLFALEVVSLEQLKCNPAKVFIIQVQTSRIVVE